MKKNANARLALIPAAALLALLAACGGGGDDAGTPVTGVTESQAQAMSANSAVVPSETTDAATTLLSTTQAVVAGGTASQTFNCAGGGTAVAFRGLDLARWRHTFAINLEAALLATQAAYPTMRQQRRGAIVNIASLAAHGPGRWMGADYAASKAGLVSLTQSLALEAARLGIRVNAVSPGMIETDMTATLTAEMRAKVGIPLQRFGKPEEIAQVVAFLLGDASAYMTGQVVHVDGGLWMRG